MSTAPKRRNSASKRFRVEMIIVAVLVVIAAGFGIALAVGGSGDESDSANPAVIVDESPLAAMGPLGDLARRVDGDPLAIGAVDAPLVLVEYSDYRCPFCAKFSRDTQPELVQRYVDEGKLRIEWRDMPIFGEASLVAARAGRAAAEQGMFWEFNSAVFAAAPASGHADLNPVALRGFAEQVGIPDVDKFVGDAASEKYDDAIWNDAAAAQAMGVVSTPSFALNGHPMIGAQPTTLFNQVIDDLLKAQN